MTIMLWVTNRLNAALHYLNNHIPHTASEDYNAVSRPVIFAPGQTTASVLVGIIDDDIYELTESFTAEATLQSPDNGQILIRPMETLISILNNDGKSFKI